MEGRRSGGRLRKLRIAAAFRSSLSSCGSRNLSNSLPDSVFLPQPQPLPRPSFDDHIPDLGFLNTSSASYHGSCSRLVAKCTSEMMLPRQISERYLSSAREESRHILRCPPASPITPLNPFLRHRLTPNRASEAYDQTSSSSTSSSAAREVGRVGSGLFQSSSEDEGDGGISSESSSSEKTIGKRMGKAGISGVDEEGTSYAVVKRSRDPYGDFRRSMVEMIVEKRMYGTREMESLLEWFLRLNEGRHHATILRAFTDIWESLYYL